MCFLVAISESAEWGNLEVVVGSVCMMSVPQLGLVTPGTTA